MRYLAVPETPRRSRLAAIRHWGHGAPQWHAVVDTNPKPIKTMCGLSYTTEAHRTWDQTMSAGRCPHCEQRVISAGKARSATFIGEPSPTRGVQSR